MRNLFRSFERSNVEYLLISGQASVLYGAALFSEDIDIWIRPASTNISRFRCSLAAIGATFYKLTPPLSVRNARFGHGFHFLVPSDEGTVYLDVMGQPPRVRTFSVARQRARVMKSPWGQIPVVDIPELVEVKKTRRLADYEVISKLVDVHVASHPAPSVALLSWAIQNSFVAEQRASYLGLLGRKMSIEACRRQITKDLATLQQADVDYWRPRIAELRELRLSGGLSLMGARVEP